MRGISYFIPRKTPLNITPMPRFQSSIGYSGTGSPEPTMPALLCAKSRRPNSRTAVSTIRSTSAGSDTSVRTNTASPPASRTIAAVCSPFSSSMSAATTRAPCSPNNAHVARPIPCAAPVTMTTFPSKFGPSNTSLMPAH